MAESIEAQPAAPPGDLLLIAADFDERRLLFAELREAGYEVMAVAGLVDAVRALVLKVVAPPLIVWDLQGDQHATPAEGEMLLQLGAGAATIVIVGATDYAGWESLRPRLAALLKRPLTIGQIVDAVRNTRPPGLRT